MKIIEKALREGRKVLSEYDSKNILSSYQIPTVREILVDDRKGLFTAVREIGYPVVLKGCSSEMMHKTEKNLVRVDIRSDGEAEEAFDEINKIMNSINGKVLVQQFVKGERELVVGMNRDPQFGSCVMFGLGGIFTEILKDVSFRVAPLGVYDAFEMMAEIRGSMILEEIRGMAAADKNLMADILVKVGRLGLENENIKEIDINPIIIKSGGEPVVVDCLIVLN
ncbi:MAG: acetate--CoA ligase family protein [Deltaproteobacteria bacterium]|nr:acetate--CoA ligase family protein [Deltaproteobacteria bacterium]